MEPAEIALVRAAPFEPDPGHAGEGTGHAEFHLPSQADRTGALAVAIALFINRRAFTSMAEEFLQSRALLYLSGILTMPAGIAIILTHNVWGPNWRVVVTCSVG